jgi:sugar-phosphatase
VRDIAPALNAEAEAQWLAKVELSDAEGLTVLAGAQALYETMPDRHRAVVTSGGRALAKFRLTAVRLSVPAIVVGAEDVERGKPSPDGYLLAAELLGIKPKDCLVIEDTPPGIAAGRAAGAQVLAVATTFPSTELIDADIVVSSLAPVTATVEGGQVHLAIGELTHPDVA